MKEFEDIRWSINLKAWHFPDNYQSGSDLIERWGGFSKWYRDTTTNKKTNSEIKNPNSEIKVMLSLVYGCGLRRSEVLELTPGDIDRDRKLISIRPSKGFKYRLVPLSDRLIRMVDDYLNISSQLIFYLKGRSEAAGTVREVLRRYSKRHIRMRLSVKRTLRCMD